MNTLYGLVQSGKINLVENMKPQDVSQQQNPAFMQQMAQQQPVQEGFADDKGQQNTDQQ